MRRIVGWCLDNRPVAILFALVLMGAGVFSMFKLNQELFPSIDFPSIYIVTTDPGANPAVVDRDVTVPIAAALNGLPHEQHVFSTSNQNFSQVQVEFTVDSNTKDDQDAVNQRLTQVQLPDGVGKPLVESFSFNALPSMTYSLASADGNLVRATTEAKSIIQPALQAAQGVAEVHVSGGEQAAVAITLDPAKLAAHGLSPFQVSQALQGAQVDLPAGQMLSGTRAVPVQVLSGVKTVEGLQAITVGVTPATPGRPPTRVTLGDVATVVESPAPVNGISRTDGLPSLAIQVIRNTSDNAVTMSGDVRSRVSALHLDPNDRLSLVYDAASGIKASLNDLILEGLIGAFLAVLVIFFFLRSLRATLVTAVSLPTSVLVALLGTNLAGYSLNVLTLAGLTIAVGRIIDDAIVVLENSYRHLQQGEPARLAALNGASEVGRAVISSTLTTVAVFLPIGVVGGIISKFFLPFSLTVTISLLASLLVALTLIPVLVSFFLQRHGLLRDASNDLMHRVYRPVLGWALGRPSNKAAVLAVTGVLFLGALGLVASPLVPKNFFDFGGSEQLDGTVTLPPGTTTAQTSEELTSFESAAQADPGVKLVQVTMSSSDYGAYTAGFETNVAQVLVLVKDRNQGPAVAARLQQKLDALYGIGNAQIAVSSFGPSSNRFEARISGHDQQALREASDRLVTRLQTDGDLTNVKSDLAAAKPQLSVTVDPNKAAAHGLNPRTVGQLLAGVLTPVTVGTLNGGPPITMSLDPSAVTAQTLPLLMVAPGTQLKDIAVITNDMAPDAINRRDGTQLVTVSGDIQGSDTTGISQRATKLVQSVALPGGVTLDTGGTTEQINQTFGQMFLAIGVAIALVFIILVAFFGSIATPFVILMSMPLALIGAIAGLLVTRNPLGLPSLLGVLMVFGIVVSNAILLIDFTERARARNPVRESLFIAGAARLRPILMTAIATVVALLPVAIGFGTNGGGGLISKGLAVVVEGGLISSTVFTLVVVPVVYSLIVRRGGRIAAQGRLESVDQRASTRPGEVVA